VIERLENIEELNQREQDILRSIVNLYILKAVPVGSRKLSKFLEGKLELSAATLRNIMSDLEELNYIGHPHTSAGRIPTDKGYRFYVDSLVELQQLSQEELNFVSKLQNHEPDEKLLSQAGQILALLSGSIGLVRIPHLRNLIVEKVQLINISSNRLLVVLALDSNIVRHVTFETEFDIELKQTDLISNYINEKVSGRKLSFIQENFSELIKDIPNQNTPLLRLFINSVDKLFHLESSEKVITKGTQNVLNYPEFDDLNKVKSIIELVENKDLVIHLLESNKSKNNVIIGNESGDQAFQDYSIVMSNYKIGSAEGSIGLIGPKRMNYSKMLNLVTTVSKILGADK
jgi:heat-inducible transcriptional repressor